MAFLGYKFSSKINISHSTTTASTISNEHFHSLDITLYLEKPNSDFASYDVIEDRIKECLNCYSGKNLNKTNYFSVVEPTLENIADYFFEQLKIVVNEESFDLITLEISEIPTRIYSVSDRFATGLNYSQCRTDKLNILLDRKNHSMGRYKSARSGI